MNTSEQKTLKLSDYPATKEGDVKFVGDVFTKMGGRVVSIPQYISEQKTLISDYPATKEGDVKFVADVFTKMGGTVKGP